MKMTILDNKKVVYTTESDKEVISNMIYLFYAKTINGVKGIYFRHTYNYSDKQKIRVIDKREALNTREYVFEGIPTSWGALDTYEMFKKLEEKGV